MDSPKTLARVEVKENGDTFNVKAYEKAVKAILPNVNLWAKHLMKKSWMNFLLNLGLLMMRLKTCLNKFKMQEFQLWIKMEIQVLWLLSLMKLKRRSFRYCNG